MSISEKVRSLLERRGVDEILAELKTENDAWIEVISEKEDLDEVVEENRSAMEKAGLWEAFEEQRRAVDGQADEGFDRVTLDSRLVVTKKVATTAEEKDLIDEWFILNDAVRLRDRRKKRQSGSRKKKKRKR